MTESFAPDSAPSYLDLDQALAAIGDVDAMREMLQMLLDLLSSDVARIHEHMERAEFADAQQLLHSFKGCMPIFCKPEFCDELVIVEHMAKFPDPEIVPYAFAALEPKLRAVQREIADYLAASAS